MPTYQLQIKQVVDYPRCRIYRQFVRFLMEDRSIRVSGGSGLFYFTVLCSYANFRTSYRRIDGIRYTVYPGEWVCTLKELSQWFRTRFQCQALAVLEAGSIAPAGTELQLSVDVAEMERATYAKAVRHA